MKCRFVTIQMKATEQCFHVVMFICTEWFLRLSLWIKHQFVNILMNAVEQYFCEVYKLTVVSNF